MPFSRYVEIGRVALVNYGPEAGTLVVIVDVVDQNRALVDAPGQTRRQINFKRLALTDFKIDDLPRAPKKAALAAALKTSDVFAKFSASAWGQKLAKRAAKAKMTDFDRYAAAVSRSKKAAKAK